MSDVILILTVTTAAFLALAWVLLVILPYWPRGIEDASASLSVAGSPVRSPAKALRVMTWNIQFGAGNSDNNFRITGGDDPWPERRTITRCLADVAAVINHHMPDVVLLQEVDLGARRTHQINQLDQLKALLSEEYISSSYCHYWKNRFCPHPMVMGSTSTALVTLSRYPIVGATRYSLRNLSKQGLMRRIFGFKRAILSSTILVGERRICCLNTHFDAFPHRYHVPTMESQRDALLNLMEQGESDALTVAGGDLNLLPSPEQYVHLLQPDKAYYHPEHTEMTELYERFSGVPTLADLRSEAPQRYFTHTCLFHSPKVADKTTDYIFVNRKGWTLSYAVLQENTVHISDHFPVLAEVPL